MAHSAANRTSRLSGNSLRSALRYARRAGAKIGRLIADLRKSGEEVMSNVSDAVDNAVDGLVAILGQRLALLAQGMTGRRAAILQKIHTAKAELGKIEALDRLSEPAFPAPFPVLLNPWLLVGELLFVAAIEAIMTKPAIGALREYGGDAQWLIAGLVGLILAIVVFVTGKASAYVIRSPAHRDTDRHWLVWWSMTALAALGVVCLMILPVFLSLSREDNVAVARALHERVQIDQTPGLSGLPVPTAPAADQQQPAADNPLEGLRPNLAWSLILQTAALIVGLIAATLWALGEAYRRGLKVAAGYARVEMEVDKAHEQLEELRSKESAALQAEQEAADFRHSEFFDRLKRSVVEAGQIPPDATPPPDRAAWREAYYSMTSAADLGAEIEEEIWQIKEVIRRQTKDRRSLQPKRPAAEQGELPEANGKGPKANVPLPGKQHHD